MTPHDFDFANQHDLFGQAAPPGAKARRKDPAARRPSSKRNGYEFWRTEPELVDTLADFVLPDLGITTTTPIWEPAAGDGAIVDGLERRGYPLLATDIEPRSPNIPRLDFLRDDPPEGMRDAVISTNPPWSDTLLDPFIARALSLVDAGRVAGVALLLRLDHTQADGRAEVLNRACLRISCNWRSIWVPDTKRNGRWSAQWIAWMRDRSGPPVHRVLRLHQLRGQAELPLAGLGERP